jgi:hypothetical protein
MTDTATTVPTLDPRFVDALASKDAEALRAVLHPEIDFRAQRDGLIGWMRIVAQAGGPAPDPRIRTRGMGGSPGHDRAGPHARRRAWPTRSSTRPS